MGGKLSLLIGFGAGYVLGARAGRARYDQIASKAQQVWHDPRVQERAGQAQHLVMDKAGSAGARVASTVSDKATGRSGSGPRNDTSLEAGG